MVSPSNLVIIFYIELFRIENLAMRPSIYERRFFDVFRDEIWNRILESRARVWLINGSLALIWLAWKCQLGWRPWCLDLARLLHFGTLVVIWNSL